MVNLIKEAGDASQRLAAIDLAKTVFGADIAANLSKDYDYLQKIKDKADSIAERASFLTPTWRGRSKFSRASMPPIKRYPNDGIHCRKSSRI